VINIISKNERNMSTFFTTLIN